MGFLLGFTRTRTRSDTPLDVGFAYRGARAYCFKPFYRKAKVKGFHEIFFRIKKFLWVPVTVIGAISIKQALAVMTIKRFFQTTPACCPDP